MSTKKPNRYHGPRCACCKALTEATNRGRGSWSAAKKAKIDRLKADGSTTVVELKKAIDEK